MGNAALTGVPGDERRDVSSLNPKDASLVVKRFRLKAHEPARLTVATFGSLVCLS